MQHLTTVLVGVLSSLIASALFLFALFRIRPNLVISPFIATDADGRGTFYSFKIINKAPRPAINVRAELTMAEKAVVDGGEVCWEGKIPLVADQVFEIGGHNTKDPNAEFAFRFVTDRDLGEIWKNNSQYLTLRVVATDSVTGFSRTFRRDFHLKRTCLKPGTHGFGDSLDVT